MARIELMRAHWVRHTFPKHFHDCYTIGINDGGAGNFECRHNKQEASPGSLNLIEPGEIHTGRASAESGWVYRDFYITIECMRELGQQADFERLPEFRSPTVHDPELANQFRRAYEAITATTPQLEQEYFLLSAIRCVCKRHTVQRKTSKPPRGRERVPVARICDYVHAHYAEETTGLTRIF